MKPCRAHAPHILYIMYKLYVVQQVECGTNKLPNDDVPDSAWLFGTSSLPPAQQQQQHRSYLCACMYTHMFGALSHPIWLVNYLMSPANEGLNTRTEQGAQRNGRAQRRLVSNLNRTQSIDCRQIDGVCVFLSRAMRENAMQRRNTSHLRSRMVPCNVWGLYNCL